MGLLFYLSALVKFFDTLRRLIFAEVDFWENNFCADVNFATFRVNLSLRNMKFHKIRVDLFSRLPDM